jgi:tRNA(Ile)-lysidine synthase
VDVEDKVFSYLSAAHVPRDGKRLAVAFSGGGDSTALLSLLLKWANGVEVYAFIVDHGLRAGSADEAELAVGRARHMGAQAEIFTCQWPNGIPTTGIQEKARKARYQRLAHACGRFDISGSGLFLGHNRDDQAETVFMRDEAGSGWRGLAGMAEHAAFPVCPSVADVSVMRPLLTCSRQELRAYNRANGLVWIRDPSNENRSFARIRARDFLSANLQEQDKYLMVSRAASEVLAQERIRLRDYIRPTTQVFDWGGISLLPSFHHVSVGQAAEALKYIIPAYSGQGQIPSYDKRMNLARRMRYANFSGATLGGLRFVPYKNALLCVRDLGGLTGRHNVPALAPLWLNAGVENEQEWDNRFGVVSADEAHVDVVGNHMDRLTAPQRTALASIPAPARKTLPVFIQDGRIAFIPFVQNNDALKHYQARPLAHSRLSALLGQFD